MGDEATTTKTEPTNGAGGATPPAAKPDDPPAWFQKVWSEHASKVENRMADFGRQLAKTHERLKEPKQETKDDPPQVSREDLSAALALGEIKGQLPAEARAELDRMIEEGRGYGATLEAARMIAKFAKAGGDGTSPPTKGATPTIPGHAATAAQNPAQHHPRSMEELLQLKAKDPKAYEALMDPNSPFDPTGLPRRLR